MRIVVAVLNCFLVAVIIGSAVADEQGGATKTTSDHVCAPEVGDQAKFPLYRTVPPLLKTCYVTLIGNTTVLKGDNMPREAIQAYYNGMCKDATSFSECLEAKASTLEVCSNPLILKTFNIMRHLLVKTVETGCAEGGKVFVTLTQGFTAIDAPNPLYDEMLVCTGKTSMIVGAVGKSDVDISSKIYILHKEFNRFVECFSTLRLDQPLRESLDHLTNEISTSMKCIHPVDGTLVPCVSIGADLISVPSVCEAKTHNSPLDLHDVLENDVGNCFDYIMQYDTQENDITADNEALREDIKNFCEIKGNTLGCVVEAKLISETCLNNEKQIDEFKHLASNFKTGFDSVCRDDGRRLADIMFEVYRLKRTGHGHAVWDCVDVAKATRNEIDEHRSSSKNMRFYHEMEAFKGCLVDKLRGDQTSVAAATSLIDELLKKVECAGAEDGSAVTCESLMQHHNNHNNHNNHNHHNHHHH